MAMKRRDFLCGVSSGILASAVPAWAARKKPNIVIVMADDLGYGDIGCYGNQRIQTPNLDAMASGGVRFTDFHSSGAVCSPTRAGLMTGRYQQRCEVPAVITAANHRHHGLPLEEITFAELLKDQGYRTGIFGKWHLGYLPKFSPVEQGFDEFRGFVSGNVDYISHIDQTGIADWWKGNTLQPEDGYSTHLITEHSVDFIERHKDQPFCLYAAHEAPHYPFQTPDDKADRTVGGDFPTQGSREDKAYAYKVMIEEMDEGIGKIMDTLRKHNLENDTFVFFFSDNGGIGKLGNNGPLRGNKGSLWEGGHRVPAIAYWPGQIPAGRVCHETAISLDVFSTIADIVDTKVPQDRPIDGASMLPTIVKNEDMPKRPLFWKFKNQKAMREGKWKLVITQRGKKKEVELFDLSKDLGEKVNVAKENPQLTKTMIHEINEWEKDVESD